jgi:hypothetical protein
MAPPIIGPAKREMAYTIAIFAPKAAHFAGGIISVIMVIPRAKLPPPPIPWNALKMILHAPSDAPLST